MYAILANSFRALKPKRFNTETKIIISNVAIAAAASGLIAQMWGPFGALITAASYSMSKTLPFALRARRELNNRRLEWHVKGDYNSLCDQTLKWRAAAVVTATIPAGIFCLGIFNEDANLLAISRGVNTVYEHLEQQIANGQKTVTQNFQFDTYDWKRFSFSDPYFAGVDHNKAFVTLARSSLKEQGITDRGCFRMDIIAFGSMGSSHFVTDIWPSGHVFCPPGAKPQFGDPYQILPYPEAGVPKAVGQAVYSAPKM